MDISQIDPGDLDLELAGQLAAIASTAMEGVAMPPPTAEGFWLAHTVAAEGPPIDGLWVAREDGTPVGYATTASSQRRNLEAARLGGAVLPDHQQRGVGRALLDRVRAGTDRRYLFATAWETTAGEQALPRLGFEDLSSMIIRRIYLDEPAAAEDDLRDEVKAAAGDYELFRQVGPTPEAELPDMVVLREAINDGPSRGVDYEDWPTSRIAAYESSLVTRKQTQHTVVARHRESGEPAGITIVCVDEIRPLVAAQEDTSVLRAHRGHRLGLALKLEMIDWLRADRPDVGIVDTWNASQNEHMITVNDRLGMKPVAQSWTFRFDRERE
ncbi:GNAT family N-acetyltransferase [Nocardioides speluncae]|uniref:GNAT family N-acetyltransferase n=1 Tax=Nocardioides speluncae TaxID=2670337 RepID=UPI0013795DBE|nr:GNAT family N-acetyltransferase [Nocardioides speluncae]